MTDNFDKIFSVIIQKKKKNQGIKNFQFLFLSFAGIRTAVRILIFEVLFISFTQSTGGGLIHLGKSCLKSNPSISFPESHPLYTLRYLLYYTFTTNKSVEELLAFILIQNLLLTIHKETKTLFAF